MTQARTTAFILDHTISSPLLFQLEQVSRKQGNNERIGPVLDGLAGQSWSAGSLLCVIMTQWKQVMVEIEMRLLRTKDRPF